MAVSFLVGISTFVGTMFINTVVYFVIITLIQFYIHKGHIESKLHNILAIMVTVILILVSHLCSISLWAWVFIMCGEFGLFETAFYFSSVNFATLGYGDIVLSKTWRLLGPLEAINGVIMLGWTYGYDICCAEPSTEAETEDRKSLMNNGSELMLPHKQNLRGKLEFGG